MAQNNHLECPKCGEKIVLHKEDYSHVLKQVRDNEFNKELDERLKLAERDKQNALDIIKLEAEKSIQACSIDKNEEIAKLKSEIREKELQSKIEVDKILGEVQKEKNQLKNSLDKINLEKELSERSLIDKFQTQLKDRDDAIERLKDMKAKLSTKLVGETLEQHCETKFNIIRPTAFPNAYFEKDNDIRTGSKGDYIFRDEDNDGNEIVSIMFEMKNENDTTATKKKNNDFLKELDKDRNEKDCEYAILVSLLEADEEL